MMEKVYKSFFRQSERIIFMDRPSSELTKYAANAMLATRISFMNELSQLCEKSGANIASVRNGIGTDHRIGLHFIYPGIGYGGSCFPKDVQALMNTAKDKGMTLGVLEAVHQANENQKTWFYEKIQTAFSSDLAGKTFALWGLSFKPGTDDVRESPAIDLAKRLLKAGAKVQAYDPVATNNAKKEFSEQDHIQFMSDSYHALEGAEALILATEWREFRSPDFMKIKELLKRPLFFDGRNQYNASDLKNLGFTYYSVGKTHGL
jgi:UDPglucose 6-dehydrogenase